MLDAMETIARLDDRLRGFAPKFSDRYVGPTDQSAD
jgi:hypothetical protein